MTHDIMAAVTIWWRWLARSVVWLVIVAASAQAIFWAVAIWASRTHDWQVTVFFNRWGEGPGELVAATVIAAGIVPCLLIVLFKQEGRGR